VQRPVQDHVVGGPARDGVHRQGDRSRDLAQALEAGRVAGVHPEPLGQPVRRHRADAVLGGVAARRREHGRGDEAVHLVDRQPGVGDGRPHGGQGESAERLGRVQPDRALGVPDHGHPAA
jgi:hypothetical protein